MRNLIFAINLTIDGCCDHTKGIVDEEMLEYHTQLVQDADLFVYGRKTYQLMVPYWLDIAKNHSGQTEAGNRFAQAFDSMDKAEGKNTEIVRTNLKDEILKLKQEQGKSILTGGADIPSQLIQLGVVDEYHIVVHPVIAGKGRRLLEGISLPEKFQLQLAGSKIFKSGSVALHYLKQ